MAFDVNRAKLISLLFFTLLHKMFYCQLDLRQKKRVPISVVSLDGILYSLTSSHRHRHTGHNREKNKINYFQLFAGKGIKVKQTESIRAMICKVVLIVCQTCKKNFMQINTTQHLNSELPVSKSLIAAIKRPLHPHNTFLLKMCQWQIQNSLKSISFTKKQNKKIVQTHDRNNSSIVCLIPKDTFCRRKFPIQFIPYSLHTKQKFTFNKHKICLEFFSQKKKRFYKIVQKIASKTCSV